MADLAATYGVTADRRDGYPGCWVALDAPLPAQAGRPRPAGREGHHVPRHRAQHHHGPGRLLAHRPLRHDRPDRHLDRPRAGLDRGCRAAGHGGRGGGGPAVRRGVPGAPGDRRLDSVRATVAPPADPPAIPRRPPRPPDRTDHRPMPGGLFELRRDDITGWWVAVVVDREFDRSRFALRAGHGRRAGVALPELRGGHRGWRLRAHPQAAGIHGRGLREGGTRGSAGAGAGARARPAGRARLVGHDRRAARPSRAARARARGDRHRHARGRPRPDPRGAAPGWHGVLPGRPELGRRRRVPAPTTCASTPTTCPRSPIASGRSWAAPRATSSSGASAPGAGWSATRSPTASGSCSRTPPASASRRTRRARRSSCGSCRATTTRTSGGPRTSRSRARRRRCARCCKLLSVLDWPPYNLVLHTAPLHERVDETYHWHWEIHPRLREIAGLELGTGLPVNPVSPEEAVDELLAAARKAVGDTETSTGLAVGRSWDSVPAGRSCDAAGPVRAVGGPSHRHSRASPTVPSAQGRSDDTRPGRRTRLRRGALCGASRRDPQLPGPHGG